MSHAITYYLADNISSLMTRALVFGCSPDMSGQSTLQDMWVRRVTGQPGKDYKAWRTLPEHYARAGPGNSTDYRVNISLQIEFILQYYLCR